MCRNRDDRYLVLIGPVAPENTVCARRAVLRIGLENLQIRIVGICDRVVFVRLKTRMAGIFLQKFDALHNLLEETFLPGSLGSLGLLPVLQRLLRGFLKRMKRL